MSLEQRNSVLLVKLLKRINKTEKLVNVLEDIKTMHLDIFWALVEKKVRLPRFYISMQDNLPCGESNPGRGGESAES